MSYGQKLIPRNYGSIFHLPGSSMSDAGDRPINDPHCHLLTVKTRQRKDHQDRLIVMEKADGSNHGVLKLDGKIHPVVRKGYPINLETSYVHEVYFAKWVFSQERLFREMLTEGERMIFENLSYRHSVPYVLDTIPFMAIDLFEGPRRRTLADLESRVTGTGIPSPKVLYRDNQALAIPDALHLLGEFGLLGAKEPAEGLVYRLEYTSRDKGVGVELMAKYVRPGFVPGKCITKEGPYELNSFKDPFA